MELDETGLDIRGQTVPAGVDTLPAAAAMTARGALDDRYLPEGELARGGMGRILRARDRRLARPLAIKQLLHPSPELRTRFDREVEITVQLQHPAIVNVVDARTSRDGDPFLAMKLVAGQSLDRAIAARPTLRERLGLLPNVKTVVDALAYAHGQGVIHRDLKPHNVLIGEFGETVVIDWGLAKRLTDRDVPLRPATPTDDIGETVAGSVMGTPLYMPLEQALGEAVDARADVYALGAILYHVITGRPPYHDARPDSVLERVISTPPAELDPVALGIPVDLATIVHKAMARDAAARYPTARELADDLARFQSGQLVASHHYSLGQLVRRFISNHRALVAVVACALLVLGIGSALAMRTIVREEREAQVQRAAAEQHRAAAETSRADAEELLDFTLVDLRNELMPLGKLSVLDAAASKALAYLGRHPAGGSDQELARRALALSNLAQVRLNQGASADALKLWTGSLILYSTRVAFHPNDAAAWEMLALAHAHVADVHAMHGDSPAAIREYEAAIQIGERLAANAPDDIDVTDDLAYAHAHLGVHYLMHDNPAAARTHFEADLRLTEKHARIDAARFETDLVIAYAHLGDVAMETKDYITALAHYERAAEVAASDTARNPADTKAASIASAMQSRIGDALLESGDAARAQIVFERTVVESERNVARDPTHARSQHHLGGDYSRLGDVRFKRGLYREALDAYRKAITTLEKVVKMAPKNVQWRRDLSTMHVDAARTLDVLGKPKAALAEYRTGLAIIEHVVSLEPNNPRWQDDARINRERIAELTSRRRR